MEVKSSFPNFKNKHTKDSLITPKDFLLYLKRRRALPKFKPPKGIIFCYSSTLLDYILKNHRVKKIKIHGIHSDIYLLKDTNYRIGIAKLAGIGAPVTATVMEEFIVLGVKKFLVIGDAGSLSKRLKTNKIIVCDKAIRDEGTSHHYLPPSKYAYATKKLITKAERVLDKRGLEYEVGASWTIDAPYRETSSEVKKFQKEGVLTVEMEAAAVFAVAEYRKVAAGALFTISDYLGELEWKPKFHLSKKLLEKLFLAAVEVLLTS
ncbi:MAG: Purine phosphorylase family 1 [Parcubacteria group bacterium GW2011_GWB1_43_6]|nr:MAG: Purine phosphorylase family 1 [Parcubacteria group bacterium GW2011_GWB1_43_6]